ncbi:MAG TPA: hypothetical protein VKU01_16030 [Bryobacteraceae bacterium]|nr:hypothetical protein [Bryobacteraceae bacterium]
MDRHIRAVAVLNIVVGALSGVGALFIFWFGWIDYLAFNLSMNLLVLRVLLYAVIFLMIPCVVTGFGLLRFSRWARAVGTVLSVLQLLNIPVGTVIGLYGLWVLLSTETDMFFEPRFGEYVGPKR